MRDPVKHRACVKRYRERHLEKVKAKEQAYRDNNKEKINALSRKYRESETPEKRVARLAYLRNYNGSHSRHHGTRKPREHLREITKDFLYSEAFIKISEAMSQTIECQFCEAVIRKGSDQYFDGEMTSEGFACGACCHTLISQ